MIGIHPTQMVFFSSALFIIGVLGILFNRSHIIRILLSIELILLAVSMNFVAFSTLHHAVSGFIFTFLILTVAAAESAIGLAILIIYFRETRTIELNSMTKLKG
jgi:NADH-quinone oxidoreductase subunit K